MECSPRVCLQVCFNDASSAAKENSHTYFLHTLKLKAFVDFSTVHMWSSHSHCNWLILTWQRRQRMHHPDSPITFTVKLTDWTSLLYNVPFLFGFLPHFAAFIAAPLHLQLLRIIQPRLLQGLGVNPAPTLTISVLLDQPSWGKLLIPKKPPKKTRS